MRMLVDEVMDQRCVVRILRWCHRGEQRCERTLAGLAEHDFIATDAAGDNIEQWLGADVSVRVW